MPKICAASSSQQCKEDLRTNLPEKRPENVFAAAESEAIVSGKTKNLYITANNRVFLGQDLLENTITHAHNYHRQLDNKGSVSAH